jgi:hypothetical protein
MIAITPTSNGRLAEMTLRKTNKSRTRVSGTAISSARPKDDSTAFVMSADTASSPPTETSTAPYRPPSSSWISAVAASAPRVGERPTGFGGGWVVAVARRGADADDDVRLLGPEHVAQQPRIGSSRKPYPVPAGSPARTSGGHGVTGMRERAAVPGGSLEAARVNGSFRVLARLPYRDRVP